MSVSETSIYCTWWCPIDDDDDAGVKLMMNGKVSWLGVVVAPWCKVIVSLAWSAVNLDLDTSDGLGKQENLCQVVKMSSLI